MAQIVIAAGSVIKEPSSGPMVKIESHHAAVVEPPKAAALASKVSAKRRMGRELAIAMIATTKTGSAGLRCVIYATSVGQPFSKIMARKSGMSQMPNTAWKIEIWMIRFGGCANGNEVQWPKQKKKRGDSILDGSH